MAKVSDALNRLLNLYEPSSRNYSTLDKYAVWNEKDSHIIFKDDIGRCHHSDCRNWNINLLEALRPTLGRSWRECC